MSQAGRFKSDLANSSSGLLAVNLARRSVSQH